MGPGVPATIRLTTIGRADKLQANAERLHVSFIGRETLPWRTAAPPPHRQSRIYTPFTRPPIREEYKRVEIVPIDGIPSERRDTMNRAVEIMAVVIAILLSCQGAAICQGEGRTPDTIPDRVLRAESFATLPVEEITVFKDGHAFVLREGDMPVDRSGRVVLDDLPRPVIGTFWPYSAEEKLPLLSVKSGRTVVEFERTALDLYQLLAANIGAELLVEENSGEPYSAVIDGIPERTASELGATASPGADERLPEKGKIILLRTHEGVRVVPIDCVKKVTFKELPRSSVTEKEFRNLLTLRLGGAHADVDRARVGMVYLQKGIRWIPSYKIVLDGAGRARVRLQATLLNEMIDLDDVTANLVIGVPSFAFKDTIDPIALQRSAAQLSQYFEEQSRTAYAFSNAIMTQTARMGEYRGGAPSGSDAGDAEEELTGMGKDEDLFVFTIDHISLRKGERLVVPIVEFELDYKDVYTLDLPIRPPSDIGRNFSTQQQRELAKLFNAPKVMHEIRLVNESSWPITTAPALLFHDRQLLGQGMTTYTAVGASLDVTITAAVDIQVRVSAREEGRYPNDIEWRSNRYCRINMEGTVFLCNRLAKSVEVEVKRRVAGCIDSADNNGRIVQNDLYDFAEYFPCGDAPYWWHWYSWPWWWYQLNGYGKAEWTVTLEPGESAELNSAWHYYWH